MEKPDWLLGRGDDTVGELTAEDDRGSGDGSYSGSDRDDDDEASESGDESDGDANPSESKSKRRKGSNALLPVTEEGSINKEGGGSVEGSVTSKQSSVKSATIL